MSGTEASDAVPPIEYAVPEDGNEEMCGACRAGGILLCCEACPAAYHAPCAGYGTPLLTPPYSLLYPPIHTFVGLLRV